MQVVYRCEICRREFDTAKDAVACETQPAPVPPPAGLIVTTNYLREQAAFAGLATGEMSRWLHDRHIARWQWHWFRGNGAGDDREPRDDVLTGDWSLFGNTDAEAPVFHRAVKRCERLGLQPLVLVNGVPTPYTGQAARETATQNNKEKTQ